MKNVLIAPLDWGLGHATRCIPLIKSFTASGWNVLIATDGDHEVLLKKEFPNISFVPLKGYGITYSNTQSGFVMKIFSQIPKMLLNVVAEHRWLQKAIKKYTIDLVVSDNRYGMYTSLVPCVFVTHQLEIQAPSFLEKLINYLNYKFINCYSVCWVPDVADKHYNLAGELAHPDRLPKIPVYYLGLLSRFEKGDVITTKYDYCVSLSGPEPQRTLLEKKILYEVAHTPGKFLIVRGKPNDTESDISNLKLPKMPNVEIQNHLCGSDLSIAIQQSEYIISRSGYTTVMEILPLKKKAIFIPTPGQTEQMYLAKIMMEKQLSLSIPQEKFQLHEALATARKFPYSSMVLEIFTTPVLKKLLRQLNDKW